MESFRGELPPLSFFMHVADPAGSRKVVGAAPSFVLRFVIPSGARNHYGEMALGSRHIAAHSDSSLRSE